MAYSAAGSRCRLSTSPRKPSYPIVVLMTLTQEPLVRVEHVTLRYPGVLILTGPSSCGKGEIAKALSRIMSIPTGCHLSMGEILRNVIERTKVDTEYREIVGTQFGIRSDVNIFECSDSTEELSEKVRSHMPSLERFHNRSGMAQFTSQLEWLEYCTMSGLLVPNRWTQALISGHIEHTPLLRTVPFILDGYPRTIVAASHLLETLRRVGIPVLKVLHLSISRQEMLSRARHRGRADDDDKSLLSRYAFYTDSVQPSVDYLKKELGSENIALIDAHQPVYDTIDGEPTLNRKLSIQNVVVSALRSLGVPRIVIKDLIEE